MNCFFDKEHIVSICCDASEPTCVHLAVEDLISDLRKLSGRAPALLDSLPGDTMRHVLLVATASPLSLAAVGIDASPIAGKEEHFMLVPFAQGLAVIGSDKRGTMWGVYEVCRRYLHVDPLYLWTDHEPQQVESLPMPAGTIIDGPKTYRYRGWFINDEDLIEGFCRQGTPEKDYRFQQDYRGMLDMLIETALRLRQNLLIPCSHLDILRPEDEAIVARITQRGMYVSMHHQEPVGVHQFTLDRIWAERGGTGNVNFIDNTDFYREIWGKYIARWARYDGVIWQLGLRGRGDRPVWYQNARVPDSTQARGQLISDAIRMQLDMIKAACPGREVLSSATLWMEGMPLYRAGALKFPQGTMVIQSDFGPDQMWGEGYGETPRYPGTDYGVYYHLAFWGCGPHLIQGNRPEKIRFNFRQALQKGDTGYVVLNVANFREFVMGVRYEAELTWDIHADDADAFRAAWCRDEYEVEETSGLEALYTAYFRCFAPMDDTVFPAQMTFNDGMARRVALKLMQIIRGSELRQEDIQNKRLYAFHTTDDFIRYYQDATAQGLERFRQVHAAALAARESIPAHRQRFFDSNVLVQVEIMLGMYGWVNALARAAENRRANGSDGDFCSCIDQAAAALDQAIACRQKALWGRFIHWYDGDRLMNLRECRRLTGTLYPAAQGESADKLGKLIE